jgi:hypothetical protein
MQKLLIVNNACADRDRVNLSILAYTTSINRRAYLLITFPLSAVLTSSFGLPVTSNSESLPT